MNLLFQLLVKLYLLNDDGQWDDRGTGHISCQYSQELQGFGLFLRSEADNEELLGQRIVSEDIYQHQNETIITWTDPASNADISTGAASRLTWASTST